MTPGPLTPGQPVDPTNCEKEPIHIPGRIQPHGVLLGLREPDLRIVQIGANTERHLGRPADDLLGQPLSHLIDSGSHDRLNASLRRERVTAAPLHVGRIALAGRPGEFDGVVHHSDNLLVLELEPAEPEASRDAFCLENQLKVAFAALQRAADLRGFCRTAAEQVRLITGFDRVMVYRFDAQWNGTVIAEARPDEMEPFLGLRYPASDIPRQARDLYLRTALRLIVDAHAEPVPVAPTLNPETGRPLDMTHAVLRGVSPIHIEYLKNMGVAASMSIAIVVEGALWGLIACHHRAPRRVPFDVRTACELLGQVVSLQIPAKEETEDFEYRMRLKSLQAALVASTSTAGDLVQGLIDHHPNLLDFADSTGAALCIDGDCFLLGNTPTETEIGGLQDWLTRHAHGDVFHTDHLSGVYEPASAFSGIASGLLAIPLSRVRKNYILWFRPEVLQTVDWAGRPEKAVQVAEDGLRLSPRKSFAKWEETVKATSLPWKPYEIEAARELRNAFINVIHHLSELKRAEQALNAALDRERRIAETLQVSLLFKPAANAFAGLLVEPLYEAAWEESNVGGDFFDIFALEDGRVALVIGDVAGKGLTAATRIMQVKFALRAFLSEYPQADAALSRLNNFVCGAERVENATGSAGFTALSLAIIEPSTGETVAAIAGAEPFVILRAGGDYEIVGEGNLPLGVTTDVPYAPQTLRLNSGDTLLQATDGITEARSGNDFLGVEGMAQLAQQALGLVSLRRIGQEVLNGARSFGRGPLRDDACLLITRRK